MKTEETTDDLIEGLTGGLKPVPRLLAPGKRAAAWSLGAVLYLALLVAAMALLGRAEHWPGVILVSQIAAVATGMLASAAAFASVIPGSTNPWRAWTLLAAPVWLATLIAASPGNVDWVAVTAAPHEWLCVALILFGGAPLMIVLAAMLRRGAPLTPAATAAFAALAAASLANVAACVTLPHPNGAVTFAWHGAIVLAAVLVAAACGRRIFAWR
jgi:hypothetical protein